MSRMSKTDRWWEDVSSSYRRGVAELHAVMYPNWPTVSDPGQKDLAQETTRESEVEKDSTLDERLRQAQSGRDDRGRDDRGLDRD